VFKVALLLLLPLTLGWKLAVRPGDSSGPNEKEMQLKIAEFLTHQHFSVAVSEKVADGEPMLRATAGACHMLVAKSPAMGWDRDMIRRHATPADEVFVVFAGRIYADQPTWLTVGDLLWSRFKRELGLKAEAAPLFAVVATTSCAAALLPWKELGRS
jgi:hypothetical protein